MWKFSALIFCIETIHHLELSKTVLVQIPKQVEFHDHLTYNTITKFT